MNTNLSRHKTFVPKQVSVFQGSYLGVGGGGVKIAR